MSTEESTSSTSPTADQAAAEQIADTKEADDKNTDPSSSSSEAPAEDSIVDRRTGDAEAVATEHSTTKEAADTKDDNDDDDGATATPGNDDGDDDDDTATKFSETAMGLGLATTTQAVLTPVVGLGLMGAAAHDAIACGATGTYHRAGDLIGKTDKQRQQNGKKNGNTAKATAVGEAEMQETMRRMSAKHEQKKRVAATPVDVFDPDTADYKALKREYVDRGIPFVLKRAGGCRPPISDAAPPVADDGTGHEGSISVVSDSIKAVYPGIDDIIKKLLPRTFRAYWPLWFQGNYKSGLAHVDLGPGTLNFYFLKRGKKDVVIAPPDVTRDLVLKAGIDNLFVPGSSGNHDYLSILDKYYRVLIEEQSMLVFNNSGCLHHFTNVVEDGVLPVALSVRCKHAHGSDPRGWLNLATNVKVWWNMTDHMMALAKDGPDRRKQDKA